MRGVKSPNAHQCPTCGQTCRMPVKQRRDSCPDCGEEKGARSPHCRRCASKGNPKIIAAARAVARSRWPCDDYPERVVAMRKAGMTFAAIGRELGRTPEAVGEVFHRSEKDARR